MSDIAIRVDGLGKKYRLGASQPRYKTLRESLSSLAAAPLRRARTLTGRTPIEGESGHRPEFWALSDVSFEVKRGEVLGIIGRNGAGKSTLLKLLSRITEPTTGRIGINGRVSSLLEVGTGFHPELTGRENVYLNGAILGMSRAEIDRKFDEIVAFAEVEQFIDTQVKHFSSGMYLRLAFSVAAHLEPEILIVDEVLAVGDAAFQRKCLGKIGEIGATDRTVLLVTHNAATIQRLCAGCLLLENGNLLLHGSPSQVVATYLSTTGVSDAESSLHQADRRGQGKVRFTRFDLESEQGQRIHEVQTGMDCVVSLAYEAPAGSILRNCFFSITVTDASEQYLFTCTSDQFYDRAIHLRPSGVVKCHIPRLPLSAGSYYFILFFMTGREIQDWVIPGVRVSVVDGVFYPGAKQHPEGAVGRGVLIPFSWESDIP